MLCQLSASCITCTTYHTKVIESDNMVGPTVVYCNVLMMFFLLCNDVLVALQQFIIIQLEVEGCAYIHAYIISGANGEMNNGEMEQ